MTHEILTVSTSDLFGSSLRYIEKRLEPFKKVSAVTTKLSKHDDRNQLTIIFNNVKDGLTDNGVKFIESARKIATALVDAVADIIVTDCKSYYIETSLKLPIEDEICRHAFIRALSNFDRTADKAIAKSLITLTPNFLLDSFYTFSIDVLKKRWQEVCALANDNACYLVCDGTFRELLRFLISNLESREPEVHLFERAGKMELLSGGLKPINVYVNDELSQDVQVISKLISVAPKRIYLHQEVTQSPVLDLIQSLFGNCVQIVQS